VAPLRQGKSDFHSSPQTGLEIYIDQEHHNSAKSPDSVVIYNIHLIAEITSKHSRALKDGKTSISGLDIERMFRYYS
jgi:hypothetical protein